MAACQFDSPSLVTSVSGTAAAPTFAFDVANTNYFGLGGTFTSSNGAVCSFPTRSVGPEGTSTYEITPIIVTSSSFSGKTTTCSILHPPSIDPTGSGSTTYTGIECPTAIDNKFAPGTYTLRFRQDGTPSISSQVFLVASPTTVTDTTTKTYYEFTTFPVQTTSTITATKYTSTATETASRPLSTTTTNVPITVTSTTTFCSSSSKKTSSASTPSPSSTPTSLPVSKDGNCGSSSGQTCLGSSFGNCCSRYGYCGSTNEYCLVTEGCQRGFGTCSSASPISSSARPTPTKISPDGTCGGANGYSCTPGNCCSQHGWCGVTSDHCGEDCQPLFGTCIKPGQPQPSPTKISLDGSCGGISGQTCLGSEFGDCCSQHSFCGRTPAYCSEGCQPKFGDCNSLHKRSAGVPGERRNRWNEVVKRAVGGKGPDYTYPPLPHTTITQSVTHMIIVFPSGQVSTTTVSGVTTKTVGGVITLTQTSTVATRTATICPKA
ncbi:carbohydrate-binding module family 18 protein [Lentithecium fluviatile CBS 122367]|uniref:Carbohydrate-binding module family 18 protein n=1 Tax=Lentithecium fluviatile CBS 122367 TaxID=1168545 RepID=A0A6G1JI06_9PLEO|nr:carbohydrate-binding module family 18 protein [Lentithecium fluviatile CBS 122367]